jgi:hypothetical protein
VRRSIAEAAILLSVLFVVGCAATVGAPLRNSKTEIPLKGKDYIGIITDYEREQARAKPGFVAGSKLGLDLALIDPQGSFDGQLTMTTLPKVAALAPVKSLRRAKVKGTWSGDFISINSEEIRVDAVAVVTQGANSICLSFSGRSQKGYKRQVVRGQFTVLGGTGTPARIRARGGFISVEPKPDIRRAENGNFKMVLLSKSASLGSPRKLPAKCIAATKPPAPPPPPPKVEASFGGFVFAPSGATSVPAGAQVYPDRATVTGAVGCGASDNLYGLITYSGPDTKTDGAIFGPKGGAIQRPVKAGKNLVLFLAAPPNGDYEVKLTFEARGSPAFVPSLRLQRGC